MKVETVRRVGLLKEPQANDYGREKKWYDAGKVGRGEIIENCISF